MPLYAVIQSRGPAWDESRIMDEQAEWSAHAQFMDALASEGFIVVGGPLEGTPETLLVIRATTEAEIEKRLAIDPWRESGLLVIRRIHPWRIRLGKL